MTSLAQRFQALDSDLTALAAIVTTPFGRIALSHDNAAAFRSYIEAINQSLPSGQIYVGNGIGIGTAVTPTGDVTISNAGVTAIAGPVRQLSLADFYTDASVGGAEADIYSHTVSAGRLAANGDKIDATYGGNFVTVGTELTQLKAYFGGTGIYDSTAITVSSGTSSWRVRIEIIRVTATVVRYAVSLNTSGASGFVYANSGELTGLTLSATNVIKITGISSGVGSGAGDIVGKLGNVTFRAAA